MIFGLTKYFCITKMRGNSHYTELFCQDEENENKGYINYFIYSYISIITAVLLMPFLYFLRMFLSKKYMEITNNNALLINFKIYFFEFFIFLIAFIIGQYGADVYKHSIFYEGMMWAIYGLVSDFYELFIFIILKATNLFLIFIILIFRALIFHVYKSLNTGDYLYYLIVPLITNLIGAITFSYFSDDNLLDAFKSPLNEENKNEINSHLINENNNNKITDGGNRNVFNDNNFNNYGTDYITPSDDNYNETNNFENNTNMDEVQILRNENIRLKNENNELKSQNKYQNVKIQTLESKTKLRKYN